TMPSPLVPVNYEAQKPNPRDRNEPPDQPGANLKRALTIPAGLPGADANRIEQLKNLKGAERDRAIDAIFPALPDLGPDVEAAPGPDGRPLMLADLQRLALSNSPLIRQAAADVKAAQGAALQAGLPPNPNFGFEGDTMGTAGGPGYIGGFVEQLIKTAGKL